MINGQRESVGTGEKSIVRHLRPILRDFLVGGMLRHGHLANIGGIRWEGRAWQGDFNRLQIPRTFGDFWAGDHVEKPRCVG